MTATEQFKTSVKAMALRTIDGAMGIEGLTRLSGGASQETWAFDVVTTGAPLPLILRRAPPGVTASPLAAGLDVEAELMRAAGAAGVPSPGIRHVLTPDDGMGEGFLMDRIEGETLGHRIVRADAFADVRPRLAAECGRILAAIHAITTDTPLKPSPATVQIDDLEATYRGTTRVRPVFELAFRWLRDHAPSVPETLRLAHGDFRNGNLIVGPEGVRAVLDWELAHLGDPMEDLGWLCVNSWRFGVWDKPVGGFGMREDLFAAYEAAGGGAVDPQRVRYWEVLGTLRWGVICTTSVAKFRDGEDRSVERPIIARRASETELDLLDLIAPEA